MALLHTCVGHPLLSFPEAGSSFFFISRWPLWADSKSQRQGIFLASHYLPPSHSEHPFPLSWRLFLLSFSLVSFTLIYIVEFKKSGEAKDYLTQVQGPIDCGKLSVTWKNVLTEHNLLPCTLSRCLLERACQLQPSGGIVSRLSAAAARPQGALWVLLGRMLSDVGNSTH